MYTNEHQENIRVYSCEFVVQIVLGGAMINESGECSEGAEAG